MPLYYLNPVVSAIIFAFATLLIKRSLQDGAGATRAVFVTNTTFLIALLPLWWIYPSVYPSSLLGPRRSRIRCFSWFRLPDGGLEDRRRLRGNPSFGWKGPFLWPFFLPLSWETFCRQVGGWQPFCLAWGYFSSAGIPEAATIRTSLVSPFCCPC